MKVIIFNDKDNFEGSLNLLNDRKKKGEKRFWRIELYHPHLFNKLGEVFSWKPEELKLIRKYIYTGEYNSKILKKHKKFCKKEIEQIDEILKREGKLISDLSSANLDGELKTELENHIDAIKNLFENKRKKRCRDIDKQKRNSNGQKKLFERLKKMPFMEYKTTPLKHAQGTIYQKGVDVKIATDLINFANTNAYDIALILGGDTDLIECIRLIKDNLGKIVIVAAYFDEDNIKHRSISKDLIDVADFFINLKDFGDSDIEKMSELRRIREESEEDKEE